MQNLLVVQLPAEREDIEHESHESHEFIFYQVTWKRKRDSCQFVQFVFLKTSVLAARELYELLWISGYSLVASLGSFHKNRNPHLEEDGGYRPDAMSVFIFW